MAYGTWAKQVTTQSLNDYIGKHPDGRCPELKDADVDWGCTDCPLDCIEDMECKAAEAWHRTLRERGIDGLLEVYGIRVWE